MKMLIVDDEPIICQGLRYTIDWESIGVSIVGEAYSGVQALELAEKHEVDLVLTDIQMKKMDGLVLTERLKEKMPGVRIIIISGYDQFRYAQQAVRLGVKDYLLKPIQIDELVQLVKEQKEAVEQERLLSRKRSCDRLAQWLNGLVQGEDFGQEAHDLPTDELGAGGQLRFISSQLENYGVWSEKVSEEERTRVLERWKQVLDRLQEQGVSSGATVLVSPNLMVSVWIDRSGMGADTDRIAEGLAEAAAQWGEEIKLFFAVSHTVEDMNEARGRCLETIDGLRAIVLQDRPSVIRPEDSRRLQAQRTVPASFPEQMERELFQAMFKEEPDQVDNVAKEMSRYLRTNHFLMKEAWNAYEELRLVVLRRLRAGGIKQLETLEVIRVADIDLNRMNSYESFHMVVRQELALIYDIVKSAGAGKHFWVIERAKQLIAEHNLNDLKVSDVAAELNITPSYFSLLFKQHTGASFTEYVNACRMEEAKRLLRETTLRVFEIANRVGYKEYKYFVSVFKEHTGLRPSDYRDIQLTRPD